MVLFRQKWFYSIKSGCIRAKVVVFGQTGCIWAKLVVFQQSGCIRANFVVFGL